MHWCLHTNQAKKRRNSLGASVSIIERAAGKLERSKNENVSKEIAEIATPAPTVAADPVAVSTPKMAPRGEPQSAKSSSAKEIDINLARLHQLGMVTPDGGRSAISEEFRLIKRPLIEKAFNQADRSGKHGNLIMVTSALPGEGKTFCSINLAISIAMEMDHTVLLVDADVARPSVLNFFGLQAELGLMDLLLDDKLDLADVMLKTNVDTLSILSSGTKHKHATELLASQAMSNFLNEIAIRYPDRIIICDSPPALITTEARALASQMGQIVLVVEAESTTQHAVKEVLRHIGSGDNVNLIYNKARAFPGASYYGYYYK